MPCTIFYLTEAKVLLLLLTHSSPPQQVFVPEPHVSKRQSSYWSVFSRRQRRKMHTSRSSRSTTYSYRRCAMCVCVCVSFECIRIVYMSACKQCYRLCNNSYCLKSIMRSKFTYITVFDGVCQFLLLYGNLQAMRTDKWATSMFTQLSGLREFQPSPRPHPHSTSIHTQNRSKTIIDLYSMH